MLERLALTALAAGFIGYTIARHLHRNEAEQRFGELMESLPWFVVDGIDDHISGEPMLTVTYGEDGY